MAKFAKLFGDDDNQVLVKIAAGDGGIPQVRVYCSPDDSKLGVCSVALIWDDNSEESWALAENALANMTEAEARTIAAYIASVCDKVVLGKAPLKPDGTPTLRRRVLTN